jgi:SAM-dependent methyltransferase
VRTVNLAKLWARQGMELASRGLALLGAEHSPERRAADASGYWRDPSSPRFASNAHLPGSPVFADNPGLWEQMGETHLALLRRSAQAVGQEAGRLGTLLDHGCGGGAITSKLAPFCDRVIAADPSPQALDQCARLVQEAAPATTLRRFMVNIEDPGSIRNVDEPVDWFVSTHVFGLHPSRQHSAEVLRAAFDIVRPGGAALIQIKYTDGSLLTRSRTRRYTARTLANMTTWQVPEFWSLCEEIGWEPENVKIVEKSPVDRNCAYYTLRRPRVTANGSE